MTPAEPQVTTTSYRLVRPRSAAVGAPALDDSQQAVVDHPGGPLLVLAGPGTGKTTTLVEAIVDRIENRGADPDSVLALTFSRKAAEQLRDRVTARLGRTTSTTMCSTFHSFAYGLIRKYSPPELYAGPAAPAQRARAGRRAPRAADATPPSRRAGPTRCAVRSAPAGSRARCRPCSAAPARRASTARRCVRSVPPTTCRPTRSRALPRAVPPQPRPAERHRLHRPDPAGGDRGAVTTARSSVPASRTCSSMSTRTPIRRRSSCSGALPATAET